MLTMTDSAAVMPTLARTQQMMKEQLGQADDKVRQTSKGTHNLEILT
jgi:hypothetical protein